MPEIVVHILNDEENRPRLRDDGAIEVRYKAKREGGEEVFRECAQMPASPEEFHAYVAEQAREESGGGSTDPVTIFGGPSWRG